MSGNNWQWSYTKTTKCIVYFNKNSITIPFKESF